ncbi:MAG: hypothetical protein IGR93_08050 [Hydrococcus sp. C42_A2020_068]|nr:hypothetical protein [Hydrococcus sp. C42_A2020_068]
MDIVKKVADRIADGANYLADEAEKRMNYSRGFKDGYNDRPRNRFFENLSDYQEGYEAGRKQAQADTKSPSLLPRSFQKPNED